MTDMQREHLTPEQERVRSEWGYRFIDSYSEAIKIARGETPRQTQGLRDLLEELKREAEEDGR